MKIRNLMGALVVLAGLAFTDAAFAGGSVWEVLPGTPANTTHTANEMITFRMRLLSPNWDKVPDAADRCGWKIKRTALGQVLYANDYLAWAGAPMKLGLVLNGKTVGADWGRYEEGTEGLKDAGAFVPAKDNIFHDMHFTYTTRCGDYALPLRLAADEKGNPVGGENGNNYYFVNGPGDPAAVWEIVAVSNGYEIADLAFERQASTLGPGSSEIETPFSYSDLDPDESGNTRRLLAAGDYLRNNNYTVETLKFDDESEETKTGETYWRVVSEAGDDNGYVVTADEGFKPTVADTEVYAWIEPDVDPESGAWADHASWTTNDYAVTIPAGSSVTNAVFRDPDGIVRSHRVFRVKLGSTDSYRIPLHGQHRGQTARVVLASTPHYNYLQDGTGAFLLDYRTARVYCDEPAAPAVLLGISGQGARATYDLAVRDFTESDQFNVTLNQATNIDLFVKLSFKLGDSTDFPTNIISISDNAATGYLVEKLLPGMTVKIAGGETAPAEADQLWLYVLGATTNTQSAAGLEITATAYATNAVGEFVKVDGYETAQQTVIIRGRSPEILYPNGTEEMPTILPDICQTLNLRLKIEDSYRNLALLDKGGTDGWYTVTMNRGYGKDITITNTASGGPLVPGDYFSEGYAYLDLAIPYTTETATWSNCWIVVTNPERRESNKVFFQVTTIPLPVVTAMAPKAALSEDGYYVIGENDDPTKSTAIRFELSNKLAADDYEYLYAFLEPANEAASNLTTAAFLTTAEKPLGVPIKVSDGFGETGRNYKPSTKATGLEVKDGDGDDEEDWNKFGSVAEYNIVLSTDPTNVTDKVFRGYDGQTERLRVQLRNRRPLLGTLSMAEIVGTSEQSIMVPITNGIAIPSSTPVRINDPITVKPHPKKGWDDVNADLNATDEDQVVLRWLAYEIDEYGEQLVDVAYTYGKDSVYTNLGFNTEGVKRIVVQAQDKDMRLPGTVVMGADGAWHYYVDPDLGWEGDESTYEFDYSIWGPELSYTFVVSANPVIVVSPLGYDHLDEKDDLPVYTEAQLRANDRQMRFEVNIAEGYSKTEPMDVKVTIEPAAPGAAGEFGWFEPSVTNLTFRGTRPQEVVQTFSGFDFDATYKEDKHQTKAKYKITVEVLTAGAVPKYNTERVSYFYLQNNGPDLELVDMDLQTYLDNPEEFVLTTKDKTETSTWQATDIESDLTNLTITATITRGAGSIVGADGTEYKKTYSESSTNAAQWAEGSYAVTFSYKFTSPGTNEVTFVAMDKDKDVSEKHTIRYYIEPSKNLYIYPAKPTSPSTESDDIADYFSASGIGYGRVWAEDGNLSGISYWMHTWTFGDAIGTGFIFAKGYEAGETEQKVDSNPAYVDSKGGHDGTTGYTSPLKDLDSFFYRWFTKIASDNKGGASGGTGGKGDEAWTAYKPVPQLSKSTETVAAQTRLQIKLPTATGQGSSVYDDTFALAIFSRERIWSDNMGDINADWVPDSYMMKYKLVEDYTAGNDLKDANYSEDGKTPLCQDYLPMTEMIAYSKLIPSMTAIDNIQNAQAFTPRLKIRGYDDNLNDATAEYLPNNDGTKTANPAFIDGAKPEKRYEMEDGSYDPEKCTISKVEYLAWCEFKAEYEAKYGAGSATFDLWSPERPTDPTKADTDNDGITDGYEYYFWYRAHVGWIENEGTDKEVHRRLTGRRYNPRNPGEGDFITSEEIERLFDPLVPSADKTQDTDNDGLPDLLEFEIGTNPFDFDSDGDGLPDGFEVCNVGNLDPLDPASHLDGKSDTERNSDGDAMAITSWKLEKNVYPTPFEEADKARGQFTTFAVVKADGMTDGVQWYAVRCAPGDIKVETTTNETKSAWSFTADGHTFVTYVEPLRTADGYLAVTLAKDKTFVSTKPETVVTNMTVAATDPDTGGPVLDPESGEPVMQELAFTNTYAGARYPVRLAAGLPIADVKETKVVETTLATNIEAKVANACWIYGRGTVRTEYGEVAETAADYGCLALGGQLAAKEGLPVCALPDNTRDVAFLHYLVYQEFGFDPRTAWKAKDPLNVRWGKAEGGEAEEGIVMIRQGGYAGKPARTRDFSNYDEFLVYSFFLNNGCDMTGVTRITDSDARAQIVAWDMFTTNPQGPDEKVKPAEGETASVSNYGRGTNGADTDDDGVPDGWELYVMAGPKTAKGEFVFAPPYAGFVTALSGKEKMPESYFSPFRAFAQGTETSNQIYLGGQENDDGLNQYQEFEGTDSIGYYAQVQTGNTSAYSTTIAHVGEWTWFNKFFPTDPWNVDTDGDTLSDAAEKGVFNYGDVDTGKTCIPGGGLNPCSTDTDLDGLPDPWESQYKGKTVYTGAMCQFAEGVDANGAAKTSAKATLQGYMDGMDGTVADAYSYPVKFAAGADSSSSNVTTYVKVNDVNQVVNRDYDHDGLENWQEYLTGTMRCWRYDDPISPWSSIPADWYFSYNEASGTWDWQPQYEKFGLKRNAAAPQSIEDDFWYMTLVDASSKYYNPHLVVDQNPSAQYFTRVTNGWDGAYTDAGLGNPGAYYYIYDRCAGGKIEDVWVKNGPLSLFATGRLAPSKYIGCSPIDEDSDHDGMDDYYELFHGLNPLLGQEGVSLADEGPCDLVFDAWQSNNEGLWAWGSGATANYWQGMRKGEARGTGFDFEVFPWLNGRQESDPDGDDIKNVEESIMARLEPGAVWHHTDPTPLWMTDSTYSNSLVRQYFQMQAGLANAYPANFSFKHTDAATGETTVYNFRDFDGYMEAKDMMGRPIPVLGVFSADYWRVSAEDTISWMYSFEENEGFDSDHDGISDHEEIESKFRSGTEPQDADSPRRRQAMYFPGKDAALQTPPFVNEAHPVGATSYPTDPSFLQYTVECWVMPESLANATIIERAVYSGETNPGDEEFMRCNFQLAVKNEKWYTKFDPNGTVRGNQVEIFSEQKATVGKWTHLAATYDGKHLRFYVNGEAEVPAESGLAPTYGSNAIALQNGAFWFDREHPLHAILVGASFKTNGDGVNDGAALDLTLGLGWNRYKDFFKGYVDEIRIWDGARSADEIEKTMSVRFDAKLAAQNRNDFYDAWSQGKYRYADDGQGSSATVPAELRFHWAFDSVFGAENAAAVAKAPHGFDVGKAPLSRPVGYGIAWWMDVLAGYTGTVYSNPAWVTWIPNTVTHLPRFDGTTLDSFYWSDDFKGDESGKWTFAKVAEPVSRWTQMLRNGVTTSADYRSTDARHRFVNEYDATGSNFARLYDFSGRNLHRMGDDLLPLGGAFVKYVPNDPGPGLWDQQGASTTWEITGSDADADGLPDWWEIYAEQNYREGLDQSKKIDWNSDVNYHGVIMKAGTAYLRDLAKGIYVDADKKIHNDLPTKFAQTADEDHNGIPDWWEDMYGIRGEAGLADHDNDGLPNYVEYLLSEVFDFNLLFSPVNAHSVNPTVPDYFYRVGELYVGEIFTDHDLVDDSWEDLYSASFASRLVWDADADADEDGWSNRSENRYAKSVMPIVADERAHYTAADGLVADYPIPTIALTLQYRGLRTSEVEKAPIVVQTTTAKLLESDFEATFNVGAAAESKSDSGASSKDADSKESGTAYTRTIGKWSNRHALGTLTPGYINKNSVQLEFCYDPSSEVYSWTVNHSVTFADGHAEWQLEDKRGTRAEFDADKRKYGDTNVMLTSKDTDYAQLEGLELRSDEDSKTATWIHVKSGQMLGTIDLQSGAFDLDLGVFKGQYVVNSTNSSNYVSLEDQTFRIVYSANESRGLPRTLYLGAADEGYVREGRNTIVAFADLDGNGLYTPGEPYGCVTDVDISWKGTRASIDLTDTTAVFSRVDPVLGLDDRTAVYGTESGNYTNITSVGTASGGLYDRIRVVRLLIIGTKGQVLAADVGSGFRRVILDQKVCNSVNPWITEANILATGALDVDWEYLYDEIISKIDADGWIPYGTSGSQALVGDVAAVAYRIVLGNEDIDSGAANSNVSVIMPVRQFDSLRQAPKPVLDSANNGIIHTASPVIKWNQGGLNSYTAFKVRIQGVDNSFSWTSDYLRVPAADQSGTYSYAPEVFANDRPSGAMGDFKVGGRYTWSIQTYNSKFKTDGTFVQGGEFLLNVQTNGYEYGVANVAVRYFGPTNTWSKNTPLIRVRAYTSPDFTGSPVAAGYVKTAASLTNFEATVNCNVVGIPKGTYYLQAFVDSNGNGVCDAWETQGYLCSRDGTTPDYLNPTAITFDTAVGKGDTAIIYLEDADTDGDGLPDAWEYAEFGSLTAKGVELLSETKAGGFVVNTNLATALSKELASPAQTAGLAGTLGSRLLSNAGLMALAMGAPTESYDSFAAAINSTLSPELVEGGVRITKLALVDGQVTIALEAETTTGSNEMVQKLLNADGKLNVTCTVLWTPTLAQEPTAIYEQELTVGAGEVTLDLTGKVPAGDSGFFSVNVEKK